MTAEEQAAADAAEDALLKKHINDMSTKHPVVPSAVDRGEVAAAAPDLRPVPSGAASFFGAMANRGTAHIGATEPVPGEFQGVTFGPGSTPMGTPQIPTLPEQRAHVKGLEEANPEAFKWGRMAGQLPWDFLMQRALGIGKGSFGSEFLLNAGEAAAGQRKADMNALLFSPLLSGIFGKGAEGMSAIAGNYLEPLKSAGGRLIEENIWKPIKEFYPRGKDVATFHGAPETGVQPARGAELGIREAQEKGQLQARPDAPFVADAPKELEQRMVNEAVRQNRPTVIQSGVENLTVPLAGREAEQKVLAERATLASQGAQPGNTSPPWPRPSATPATPPTWSPQRGWSNPPPTTPPTPGQAGNQMTQRIFPVRNIGPLLDRELEATKQILPKSQWDSPEHLLMARDNLKNQLQSPTSEAQRQQLSLELNKVDNLLGTTRPDVAGAEQWQRILDQNARVKGVLTRDAPSPTKPPEPTGIVDKIMSNPWALSSVLHAGGGGIGGLLSTLAHGGQIGAAPILSAGAAAAGLGLGAVKKASEKYAGNKLLTSYLTDPDAFVKAGGKEAISKLVGTPLFTELLKPIGSFGVDVGKRALGM